LLPRPLSRAHFTDSIV